MLRGTSHTHSTETLQPVHNLILTQLHLGINNISPESASPLAKKVAEAEKTPRKATFPHLFGHTATTARCIPHACHRLRLPAK